MPAKTRIGHVVRFGRSHWKAIILSGFGLFAALVVIVVVSAGRVPLPDQLPLPEASKVLAADGSLIGTLHGTENRTIVTLADISPNLQKAVVSAEDRNFYHEGGVSPRGIARAIFSDIGAGGAAQGGSTITQQYVRNAFVQVGTSRTIVRKLKEIVLAVKVDHKYSKDKILEFYLNTVYWGRGAYGAEAAARAYFGVSAKDLTLPEAAYLAGILRSPEGYQPDTNPKGVPLIRDVVLGDMQRDGLPPNQVDAAKATPLDFSKGSSAKTSSTRAAYFVEFVRRFMVDTLHLSDQDILTGGLNIQTTLDLKMQDAAEAAVSATVNLPTDPQAALVAMDTNGNIKAMVGGRDLTAAGAQGFNYASQRSGPNGGRQPGSSFKPFTLATFIDSGYSIDSHLDGPSSLTITSPQCRNQDGTPWEVKNFNNEHFGSLNITDATANSVNTVYAQMVDKLGPKKVVTEAQQIGGWTNLSAVCSIALGTSPVTPLEMARAYATFADRGDRPDVLAINKITSALGRTIYAQAPKKNNVLPANTADTVNQVLQSVLQKGTAAGKGIGRPAAGKTGTTSNNVDAWFVGYTPNLVAAVWMGFPPDPATGQTPTMNNVHGIQITGGTLPASIWQAFMKAAVAGSPVAQFTSPHISGKVLGAPPPCGTPDASGNSRPCPTSSPAPSPTPSPTGICQVVAIGPDQACPLPTVLATQPPPSPIVNPDPTPPGRSPNPVPSPSPSPSPSPGASPVAVAGPSPAAVGPPPSP